MNKQLLKNIADIASGYSFRTALEPGDGSLLVLQAKNISDDFSIEEKKLDPIVFKNYQSQAAVKAGDVVISSRGHFRAGVVRPGIGLIRILAASSVFIIRTKNQNIIPDYLAIFLNSNRGQQQIKEIAAGAVIPAILRKDLENIFVPIPDVETQEKIVRLYYTNWKLQKKLRRKIELLDNISESAINKLLTK